MRSFLSYIKCRYSRLDGHFRPVVRNFLCPVHCFASGKAILLKGMMGRLLDCLNI